MVTLVILGIFILIDVLIIGMLAPIIYRHARAHFKPQDHAAETANEPAEVPEVVKQRLLKKSEDQFEATVDRSVADLRQHLQTTTDDINNLIKKMAVDVVGDELKQYRDGLAKLHSQAEKDLGGFKQAMDQHHDELASKLAAEMTAEKARLIKQIDTKLGDAVGSFLLETLEHNVDLGSQNAYLMSMLEEHKDEFKKEVDDGAQQPTK